ncbi:MAG: DNA repair protein RecN [Clostridia bacterium]|nr:DNA repair protein RecN [Clostridia bacterium]
MLKRLYVKNVALISEADIEFDGGLNVLSGETGSGKSVILDSINFVLGCKADRTMIRYGESEAFVRAEFVLDKNSDAVKVLNEYDIETDGEVIISRKLSSDGKGSIKINGDSVTASMLKGVTQHLVDVHGQSEHFFLLSEDNQLKLIDSLAAEKTEKIKDGLADLISEKRQLKSKIDSLGGDESERARKLDLLGYQINEIQAAGLKAGEYEELKTRQNVLLNIEKIMSAINEAKTVIGGEGGCGDCLALAMHAMNGISSIDDGYAQIYGRLESVGAEIDDISETLSAYADNLSFDEGEAKQIDERLELIKTLIKKYGADEEHVISYMEKAQAEFEAISDSAALIEKYMAQINKCDEKIYDCCQELTKIRKAVAQSLSERVVGELKTLNIPDAQFGVYFNEYDMASADLQNVNGADKISFEFSANKGEPKKPLNKVISGGEMSRFMLAIKTQLKDLNGISTYIFDEIDSGISGFTAATVAKKFIDISRHTQILAVSHLPQVCAASDAQLLIYKVEEGGKTVTKVKKLTKEQKVEEIVRLTGGNSLSDAARRHAEELINQFKN